MKDRSTNVKYLKCSKCGRNTEVGMKCQKVLCEECTNKIINSNRNRDISDELKGGEKMEDKTLEKTEKSTKDKPKQASPSNWGKLKCSVCGQERMASGDRIEKWKGKKYICRDCKKKQKQ